MEQQQEQLIPSSNIPKSLYHLLPPTILALITGIVYYPSLSYDFQFDDIANIPKHFDIRHYSLYRLLFSGTRWISYWINSLHYKIGKFNPFSYRVGNVCTHTINGLLIFCILQLILNRLPKESFFKRNAFSLSFLTSLLFLLHPVQTQTVSYVIQGQLEGLSALFALSMTLLFLIGAYTPHLSTHIITTFFLFFLGLFSTGTKEIAIVIPALIMLVDWFFVARGSWDSFRTRLWLHIINSLLIVGMYLYLLKPQFFINLFGLKMQAGNNLGNIITDNYKESITARHFCISQFKVILHYLWIFIWPLNISVEYDWKLVKDFFSPDCIFPFLALASIAFIIYKLLQKNPTNCIAFAAIWFAINIAPRSSIIPSPELLVDYKTYLASFGWLFILSAALIKMYEWIKRYSYAFKRLADTYKFSYCLVLCLTTLLAYGTIMRNTVWESGLNFWENIVINAPGKARAYNNYGVELSQKLGRYSESIPYYKHAIALDRFYRDPYNNLAVAYAAMHQIDRAIETLQVSLQINPKYPEAYNNIASFLIEKKEFDQAKIALNRAIQLRSHYGKAYFNLGRVFMEEGEHEQAWHCFKKSCMEADLDEEAGFFGYAQSSLLIKKYDDAIFACKKVLECNPHNTEAAFSLANAYYLSSQFNQAIEVYNTLIKQTPQDARLWYNLGETHFKAGNTQEALKTFERLKNVPNVTPNLYIRIASCYEKMGNPVMAKKTLQELLGKNVPPATKQSIQTALAQLNAQYNMG